MSCVLITQMRMYGEDECDLTAEVIPTREGARMLFLSEVSMAIAHCAVSDSRVILYDPEGFDE
jgi:hypothetical protein